MVNAQQWLDANYPKEQRKIIIELFIKEKELEDSLDLTDFIQLASLDCSNNYLTNIIFPTNTTKLKHLDLGNNNFSPQDLSIFSKFTNLETLNIGIGLENYEDLSRIEKLIIKNRIESDKCNKFCGSLRLLKYLTKLWKLDISYCQIDGGLEYLPTGLKDFYLEGIISPQVKLLLKERKLIIDKISKEEAEKDAERMAKGLFTCQTGWVSWLKQLSTNKNYGQELHNWQKKNLSHIIRENDKILTILNIISKKDLSEQSRQVLNILFFNLEQSIINVQKEFYQGEQCQIQVEQLRK